MEEAEMRAKIERLERELVEWRDRNEKNKTVAANATVLASDRGFEIEELQAELAAEKALADLLYNSKQYGQYDPHADEAYRKARGL